MNNKYEVSALIVTYHPNYKEMVMTAKSLILQKNISLQIVIADDGSDEDYFEEIKAFFAEDNFRDYVLVKNKKNRGTLKNVLSGLVKCEGKYVKTISPGDYMTYDTALYEWMNSMEKNGVKASGSDYICYSNTPDGKMKAVPQIIHPQVKNISGRKLRENYILHDDIFCGAAILCDTILLLRYLSLIDDKVKYAEDNGYRMMAYCGEEMGFFDNKTVLYEVGTGISTSSSKKWGPLLRKDWNATDNILLTLRAEDTKMEQQFKTYLMAKSMRGGQRLLQFIKIRGLVLYKLRTKIRPRLSVDKLPFDWIHKLGGDCA